MVAYMISRSVVSAYIILKNNVFMHESYVEKYALDEDFNDVNAIFYQGNQVKELDYHVHDKFLNHLGKLCIP